jgi:hypothetical protein
MQLIRRIALLVLLPFAAVAGVLPDDRADLMYHYYDGGGVTIDGPSLLVRKKFAEKYAVDASYYVDMVSSASIDVITTASPYKEERTQYGVGFEYLRGKVTYTANFSNSSENDYTADTASLAISQDMFGDLTTVSLYFTRGWDDVTRRGDATFAEKVDRRIYGIDVSQIATKKLIVGLSFETITEEGFLNNPYRQVRFVDPDAALGYSYEPSATRARERATRLRSAAAGTCPTARRSRATTASTPTPGTSSAIRRRSPTRSRSSTSGLSTSTRASTRRTRRSSTRTSTRARTSRISSRATRSSPP